ncbi:MAG: peptidoglycan-binding protein [Clostridia bacterium]|nr:peptidoglycan-binding protein [Clostridia bacterium]
MNDGTLLPYIPETVTVHLGPPASDAPNVTVSFTDYIKNVASSEIYPTWPDAALRANILAQISFTLNRIYTEYYRSRGYPFDITNSTAYDQSFVYGRDIFENISQTVDEIFNTYIRRENSIVPLFAAYCDGVEVQCNGLSQWGTVPLAEAGLTPFEILTRYYGGDIRLVRDAPILGVTESYPGVALRLGNTGNEVRQIQDRLNRIRRNFPAIPRIQNPDGVFDNDTDAAVRAFQEIFSLTPDGIVGRATWYAVIRTAAAVTRLAELNAAGIDAEDVMNRQPEDLREGDTGTGVMELQYFLSFIGTFNNFIQPVPMDGIFGSRTRQSVEDFQRAYGLPATGIVDTRTWTELFRAYRTYLDSLPPNYFGTPVQPYPGTPLRLGSEGEDVTTLQTYLNRVSDAYPSIPKVTVDGIFGQNTAQAVRVFQGLFGLPVTGFVGAATWNTLANTYRDLLDMS